MNVLAEHFCTLSTSAICALPSDGDLLEGISAGHEDALSSLYDRHSKLVYSVALRILHEHSAAEDIVQEIFLQIWRKPPELKKGACRLNGWIAAVAKNRCLDLIRRQSAHPSVSIEGFDTATSENLSNDAERHEMYDLARELAESLPHQQRTIIDLCFVRGMTHEAAATLTGLPLGTIKTRVRRALQSLRSGLHASPNTGFR
jgi:RNA polymerase sigma-70 factor (ECF subfamily)